ncbi:hypothetical protein [Candidatus Hecatella orcuttiae]|jgi:hypothetical protein|uniref:hypothetical protein n=1 Tax=Candidatus Hecatella orcuttiae TaxID=1935119 RepID=UPI002867D59B|nr:hypothetical protein [Candidatus Hecatella orcuttiae]
MPDVGDAIVINTVLETAAMPAREWGTPAVVGESDYASKNSPKLYYSLADVQSDHGSTSNVAKAAQAIFAQGVRKLYAVSMDVSNPGSPTATEVENALNTLAPYAENNQIHGVCLAMITDTTLLAKLKDFADANNVIFTATNANGATVSDITTTVSNLASANGFFLAHNDSDFDGDVAAAALGVIMALKPWNTTFWRSINIDVNEYFALGDVPTLENGKANVILDLANANRISNALTTGGDPKFIDVTRTKYYTIAAIQDSIASLRLRMTKIPYSPAGLEFVRAAIAAALETMVRDGALSSYSIVMPDFGSISESDKANRILRNVYVSATLAGDIHTFELNLTIQV